MFRNQEKKYKNTRHNIGFRIGDSLANTFSFETKSNKFNSELYQGHIHNEKCLLIKPMTYMNLSGKPLYECIRYYKINHKNIMIIVDDFEFDFGTSRIRATGNSGTHNGLRSIANFNNIKDMNRIRVGVGPLPDYITPADYVLQPFSGKEETLIPDLLTIHIEIIKTWIAEGIDNCMNTYNKKYFFNKS